MTNTQSSSSLKSIAESLTDDIIRALLDADTQALEDHFHKQPLSDQAKRLTSIEVERSVVDSALQNFKDSYGCYVPRVLTCRLYQDGLISKGLTNLGIKSPVGSSDPTEARYFLQLREKAFAYLLMNK